MSLLHRQCCPTNVYHHHHHRQLQHLHMLSFTLQLNRHHHQQLHQQHHHHHQLLQQQHQQHHRYERYHRTMQFDCSGSHWPLRGFNNLVSISISISIILVLLTIVDWRHALNQRHVVLHFDVVKKTPIFLVFFFCLKII